MILGEEERGLQSGWWKVHQIPSSFVAKRSPPAPLTFVVCQPVLVKVSCGQTWFWGHFFSQTSEAAAFKLWCRYAYESGQTSKNKGGVKRLKTVCFIRKPSKNQASCKKVSIFFKTKLATKSFRSSSQIPPQRVLNPSTRSAWNGSSNYPFGHAAGLLETKEGRLMVSFLKTFLHLMII